MPSALLCKTCLCDYFGYITVSHHLISGSISVLVISLNIVLQTTLVVHHRAGSVLKPKPKPRFSVKTEPKPKPKPRFRWESQSVLRPH